jgi:hypothetical protein
MNTNLVFPLAVLASLATAAASLISFPADAPVDGRIVDLPAVTVRASPQDAAYFRAHRIVDLPRITVRPESADLALFLADNTVRIVHSPVLSPQASALDRQLAVSNALATR